MRARPPSDQVDRRLTASSLMRPCNTGRREKARACRLLGSPLTDSNRPPPPYDDRAALPVATHWYRKRLGEAFSSAARRAAYPPLPPSPFQIRSRNHEPDVPFERRYDRPPGRTPRSWTSGRATAPTRCLSHPRPDTCALPRSSPRRPGRRAFPSWSVGLSRGRPMPRETRSCWRASWLSRGRSAATRGPSRPRTNRADREAGCAL